MLKADAQIPTKERIIAATLHVLKEKGFSGATARAIAERGNVNQALVFYHFGSVKNLLLAALDATSAQRLERYRAAVAETGSLSELVALARELYAEDLSSGHTAVVAEMVGGGINDPDLGPEITRRVAPWIAFAEGTIAKAIAGTPFESILPVPDIAFAVVAFYIGVELMTALERDRSRAEKLFGMADAFMPLLDAAPR
jgi:AcrR family transcriptional regulator